MRRETSCVSFLICPFCVRATLTQMTTELSHVRDELHGRGLSLGLDAELTQFHECGFAPAGGDRREREGEGHPVPLPERLAVVEDVVVAWRCLDGEAGCFEPADELADVLPHR